MKQFEGNQSIIIIGGNCCLSFLVTISEMKLCSSKGLWEMFEGDFVDMCHKKFCSCWLGAEQPCQVYTDHKRYGNGCFKFLTSLSSPHSIFGWTEFSCLYVEAEDSPLIDKCFHIPPDNTYAYICIYTGQKLVFFANTKKLFGLILDSKV